MKLILVRRGPRVPTSTTGVETGSFSLSVLTPGHSGENETHRAVPASSLG